MYWPAGVTSVLFADGDTVRKASRPEQSATKTIARYGFVGHLWPTNCSCHWCHRDRNQLARDRPLADSNANSQMRTCQRSFPGDCADCPSPPGNYRLFLLSAPPFLFADGQLRHGERIVELPRFPPFFTDFSRENNATRNSNVIERSWQVG